MTTNPPLSDSFQEITLIMNTTNLGEKNTPPINAITTQDKQTQEVNK